MRKRLYQSIICLAVFLTAGLLFAGITLGRPESPFEGAVAQAETRRWPMPNGYTVDVVIDGRSLQKYYARGRTYIEAFRNEEYEITLRNPLGVRVAVALSVDGLNTIDARRTSAREAAKWVIEPYSQITIRGWQMSQSRLRHFYFTNEVDSYGNRLGRKENLGLISAVFFRERFDRPQPIIPRGRGPERQIPETPEEKSSAAPGDSARSAARPMARDDYPATGIGRSGRNDVWNVNMQLEPAPIASVDIRYEFRPTLVRLGILPDYPEGIGPLDRREGATGFGPGAFCPEP